MSRVTRPLSLVRSSTARILVLFLVLGATGGAFGVLESGAQSVPAAVYEINGRVLDFDENPLAGATVVLSKAGAAPSANATTDADGKYVFRQLEEGSYELSATHKCCLRAATKVTVGELAVQTTAADMILARKEVAAGGDPATLRGVARDRATGAKLAEVSIEIDNSYGDGTAASCPPNADCAPSVGGGYQHFSVVTGADGGYEVSINKGTISVWASRMGYDYARTFRTIEGDMTLDVPMQATETETVRVYGLLRGSDGQALANAHVSLSPDYEAVAYSEGCTPEECTRASQVASDWYHESRSNSYNSTTTAVDGSWEMRATAGPRVIQAYADEYLPANVRVELRTGEDRQVSMVLEKIPPDSVRIFGRVTDARTGDPLAYAQVQLENQQWGHYNSTQTDEGGRFEFYTKHGHIIVIASAYRGGMPCLMAEANSEPSSMQADSVMPSPCRAASERDHDYYPRAATFVGAENGAKELDFALLARPEPRSTFQGYVLNASSQMGVPGAIVTFFNEENREWGSATTDQDGSYKIKVHAGYYSIRVWAEPFFDAALNAEIEDDRTERLDITVTPGEKRYGYYGPYYYGRAEYVEASAASDSGPGPKAASATGPPVPTQGTEIYQGEGGGLGPFDSNKIPDGGAAPAPLLPLLALAVLASVGLVARRRRSA